MCSISWPVTHLPLEEVLVPADELELLLPVDRVVLVDVDQTLSHPQVVGQNIEQFPHGKVNQVKTGQEVEETLPEKNRKPCLNDGCLHYSQLFGSFATGPEILQKICVDVNVSVGGSTQHFRHCFLGKVKVN